MALSGAELDSRAEVVTTLWSFGPWWMSYALRGSVFDGTTLQGLVPAGMDPTAEPGERGWIVVPLGLAGLGQLLWTSRAWSDPSGDEHSQGCRHGPLGGWLGWAHRCGDDEVIVIDGTPGGRRERRPVSYDALLGGALWFSYQGYEHGSWNGPLWGLLGWGTTAGGEPCLRVLWMPVPI